MLNWQMAIIACKEHRYRLRKLPVQSRHPHFLRGQEYLKVPFQNHLDLDGYHGVHAQLRQSGVHADIFRISHTWKALLA